MRLAITLTIGLVVVIVIIVLRPSRPENCNSHANCTDDTDLFDEGGRRYRDDPSLFCDGFEEKCIDGKCIFITKPCADAPCIEETDSCAPRCTSSSLCPQDTIFCNGSDVCSNGFCRPNGNPCRMPNRFCNEATATCDALPPARQRPENCNSHANCMDDTNVYCENRPCRDDPSLFCDGFEDNCIDGKCIFNPEPCGNAPCLEAEDRCAPPCSPPAGCPQDTIYCNGPEDCTNGFCVPRGNPCSSPTPICDEDTDTCIAFRRSVTPGN